jgi:dGTPase
VRAGVLQIEALPREPIAMLGRSGSRRIDALVHDLVESSEAAGDIVQSPRMGEAMLALRTFLFANVYGMRALRAEGERVAFVVSALVERACLEHGGELAGERLAERVVDDIAGMTDRFALRRFRDQCEPRSWTEP